MAIKFAAKDPAKPEPAKAGKDSAAPKKSSEKVVVETTHVEKTSGEAVDLFDADAKPAGRKGKSK